MTNEETRMMLEGIARCWQHQQWDSSCSRCLNRMETTEAAYALGQQSRIDLLDQPIDNYTLQNCCICYGGNSFPGPMKEALKCHLSILKSRAAAIRSQEVTK